MQANRAGENQNIPNSCVNKIIKISLITEEIVLKKSINKLS